MLLQGPSLSVISFVVSAFLNPPRGDLIAEPRILDR